MSRKRIVAYLSAEDFERLERAAVRAHTTVTPYAQRALREHLEEAGEIRAMTEALANRIERQIAQKSTLMVAMLDQLAYTLFCHLPEAPAHREDAMREAGTRRYRAWKRLVQEIVAESGLEPNMEAEEDAENANHG